MSTAEKSKYIKSNFNENGTVIDIDLKLFFELDEAKIDLEYLDKISELVIKNNLYLPFYSTDYILYYTICII